MSVFLRQKTFRVRIWVRATTAEEIRPDVDRQVKSMDELVAVLKVMEHVHLTYAEMITVIGVSRVSGQRWLAYVRRAGDFLQYQDGVPAV